jgi:hypothetical protein
MAEVPSRAARASGDVEHALFLVAFGSDDVARHAWADVAASLDIDRLPFELHGLFPMMASTLRRLGIEAAELPRFDGVRKRLWSLNSVRQRALEDAVGVLARHGIRSLVTGGMAVLLYRDDLGLRPLSEVDVVVDADNGAPAIRLLGEQGWTVARQRRDGFWMDQRASVIERAGQTLTLRWSPRAATIGNAADRDGLSAPRTAIELAYPADVLAFTLIDGPTLPGYFPVRRRADALLLGAVQDVDWNAFLAQVRSKHAEPEVAADLRQLGDLPGAPPSWVTADLARMAVPLRERLAYGKNSFPSLSASLRRSRYANTAAAVTALPRELADIWELPGPAFVARAAAGRVARRLTGRSGARKRQL